MDATIVNQPELRIAGIRHIGPYDQIGSEFRRLGGILKGPPPAGARMIAVFHDDPAKTPADRLRSDAALILPAGVPTPDGLIEQRVPAGRYAKAVHQGGYQGLPGTWNALKNEWLAKSGHAMGHPSYEIYLNTPMDTTEPDLRTEIYMRLE
jgi:AraC family transcriptional regulator